MGTLPRANTYKATLDAATMVGRRRGRGSQRRTTPGCLPGAATHPFVAVPQAMPYQGSKRRIAKKILEYFPDEMRRVVEPFAGSAAISVHAVANRRVERVWLNDVHEPLVRLWTEILSNPSGLASGYARLWRPRPVPGDTDYYGARDRFNESHDPADFLYVLARCVKAAVRYNGNGMFNNSPDKRRRGARPEEIRRRLLAVHGVLAGKTRLTAWGYERVLRECTPDDLVYMDPPYQGTRGYRDRRYWGKFSHDEFCDELEYLNQKGIPFALSYDGRLGRKAYGRDMPESLNLRRVVIRAGRSTQSTLLGRADDTYESLYLSPHAVRLRTGEYLRRHG